MRKTLVLFVCTVFFTIGVDAQTSQVLGQKNNAITTSVPFLLIGPDSRIGGMGETGAAILDDANAQHWNPSKYLFAQKDFGISLSYSPWLAGLNVHDIHLLYLSLYSKVTPMDAVSFSLRYFSMGTMELTDWMGNKIKDASPHEFAIDAAYSRMLVEGLSMSVTGRFIYSNLANWNVTGDIQAGVAGAADVSLFYTKKFKPGKLYKHNFNLGLDISNIGNKISYSNVKKDRDFLPANFRLGFAYDMWIDKYNKLTFAFDINKLLVTSPPVYEKDDIGQVIIDPNTGKGIIASGRDPYETPAPVAVFTSWFDAPGYQDPNNPGKFIGKFAEEMQEFVLNFGIEYTYNNLLFVRAGYFNESVFKGNRKYLTVGAGVKYSFFALDASYIIPVAVRGGRSPLENTLRFTLSFDFNIDKKK